MTGQMLSQRPQSRSQAGVMSSSRLSLQQFLLIFMSLRRDGVGRSQISPSISSFSADPHLQFHYCSENLSNVLCSTGLSSQCWRQPLAAQTHTGAAVCAQGPGTELRKHPPKRVLQSLKQQRLPKRMKFLVCKRMRVAT